jgi:hypothetical protein
MQLIELESVKHHLRVGAPLPFNVRQTDHTLLLARGQVVDSAEQMESLVDIAEVQTPAERILKARPEELPALWEGAIDRAGQALLALPGFTGSTPLSKKSPSPWWRWSAVTPTWPSSRCCASMATTTPSTA